MRTAVPAFDAAILPPVERIIENFEPLSNRGFHKKQLIGGIAAKISQERVAAPVVRRRDQGATPNRASEDTQRAIYCIEQNIVRPRKLTRERIMDTFTEAGLRFKPLSNGGFKITVPNKAITRPYPRSGRAK